MSALDYLVLYCSDLDRSAAFYAAHGLHLVRGDGALHYSAQLDGAVVLELYPTGPGCPVTRTRLGLRVPGRERTCDVDPDGNVLDVEGS